MTPGSDRAARAEQRLNELGLAVRVRAAGSQAEIAILHVDSQAEIPRELLGALRRATVEECRRLGFRHVALALPSEDSEVDEGRGRGVSG